MLAALLRILGTGLLVILCIFLFLLLIALFFPVTYRLYAKREPGSLEARLKVRWLFGFFRADYRYPSPGVFRAKVLWHTVYDSGKPGKPVSRKDGDGSKTSEAKETAGKSAANTAGKADGGAAVEKSGRGNDGTAEADSRLVSGAGKQDSRLITGAAEQDREGSSNAEASGPETTEAPGAGDDSAQDAEAAGEAEKTFFVRIWQWIEAKYEKIKYTIQRICDKIKHILENYRYYSALLAQEDTRLLFDHAKRRAGQVWRHIRPRRLTADIRFGTGAPDTTGYLLGVFGMLSPVLGNHINVTPDFEEAVLYGEVYAAGHMTAFVLLRCALSLLLDRRLRIFIKKLKTDNR